ncbi:MAG: DUF4167 domain-containing protein [Novosphingobium sp.]
MNNNNRGNSRRRGRGNRQGGGNGGQQLNRIDSRARGNAPQLLEKYRKLAQDAHLNGDRVQAEYYLQFADHYFRVIADQRLRQEEARSGRPRDERWQDDGGEGEDGGDFGGANDFPGFDQPVPNRQPRQDRPRREGRDEEAEQVSAEAPAEDSAESNPYEPAENPFVRESRPRAGLRPRRDRDERQPHREERDEGEAPAGLDPALLPPAISASRGDDEATEVKPRKRAPRRKPAAGDAGEALEPVN